MPSPADDIEVIIRKIGDKWARHWNSRELDKVIAIYADDAVYLPPHHAAVHGRDAIHEYLKRAMEHGATGLSFEVTYIKRAGDLAYDVGGYTMTLPQEDGSYKQDRGKYLVVWQRQSNGDWKIAADCWSSDLPAPH